MKRVTLVSLTACLILVIVSETFASTLADITSETITDAEQHFEKANELLNRKEYKAAIATVSVGTAKPASELTSLDGKPTSIPEVEAAMTAIMEKAGVTGLSCAIINGSKIAYCKAFGLKNRKSGEPNNEQTVFVAASLSKPVFAYLVMLLVEDGVIDLDKPLHEFLSKPLPDYDNYADLRDDNRYRQITTRLCLSHSTGLTGGKKLEFLFDPGQRYRYSGAGIHLLQMVVEEVTEKGLEELARERVFEPLGMTQTSYVWQDDWKENAASPHDQYERPRNLGEQRKARAGGSMYTTAGDYARLLVAIIGAEGKRKATIDEMLRSQVAIGSRNWFGSEQTDEYRPINLSWCLGWVRFDTKHGGAFFHIGRGGGCQNYTVTYADKGIGVVFLSNSDNFESVARQLAETAIGDTYSPFDWCGYSHYDPNSKKEPPLHLAAYFGQKDIVERLLTKSADVKAQNRDGRTAIGLAKEQGHTEIVELIRKHASQSGDSKEIMTFFDYAAVGDMGDMEQIKSFISKGMDVNTKTQAGMTPLHVVARSGQKDIVELLIDKGADVNANTKTWIGTPLHRAAGEGHIDIVKLLIANGANVNSKNNYNGTPLHWAASDGHTNVVELLLTKGADLNAKNNEGRTPLGFAMKQGHSGIVNLLRKHGAKE